MQLDYDINICYFPWEEKILDSGAVVPAIPKKIEHVEITLFNKKLCENINLLFNTNFILNTKNKVNEDLYLQIKRYIKDNAAELHLIGIVGDNCHECSNDFWMRHRDN